MGSVEIFKKLSDREDIEILYEQFGTKILLELEKTFSLDYEKKTWNIFHEGKVYNEASFYESLLVSFWPEFTSFLKSMTIFDNVDVVLNNIKKSLLENLYSLSSSIFVTEIKFNNSNAKDFFEKLGTDVQFYNSFINKYRVWLLISHKFLKEEIQYITEFLERLNKDYVEIMSNFFSHESKIRHLSLSLGDRHKGQAVVKIVCENGTFFYKPRSARIDVVFSEFLKKLTYNNHSILPMIIPKFLDYGSYSWYEGIDFQPLRNTDMEGIENYYRRLGQLLCIIYILNGADLHYENIISHGEYPVIIDMEPLFTSRLRFKKSSGSKYLQNDLINCMEDSVRNSLILPNIFSIKNQYFEFSPFKIFNGSEPNTQEDLKKECCHIVQKDDLIKISLIIQEGFIFTYNEVCQNKIDYIELLEQLTKGLRVRFLNKPTDDYAKVMELLKNPVCLNDFRYAYAVSSKILNFKEKNVLQEEIAEQKEMLNRNIPFFEVEVMGKDLVTGTYEFIKDYFVETPFEGLLHKLEKLCEEDLHHQLKIIEEVFFTFSNEFVVNELYAVRPLLRKGSEQCQDVKNIVSQVDEVMNSVTINPFNKHLHWIGPELEGNVERGEFYYRNVDFPNSYYTGSVGILRGILNLDGVLPSDEYIKKLVADIKDDIDQITDSNEDSINIGAYNGISQYIRIYIFLYKMNKIKKHDLENQSSKLLALISNGVKKDTKLDILDGTAGVIKTLIELYNLKISNKMNSKIKRILEKCREHLIDSIQYEGEGTYFPFEQNSQKFFTGYAHGSSGIITSLYHVGKILNYDDTNLIQSLLDTERKLYDPITRGWFKDASKTEYCWGWCHGIPGILLSRVELLLEGYQDCLIQKEIQTLYEITLEKSFGTNLTFCHGDLGNAVICKYVADKMAFQSTDLDEYLKKLEPFLYKAKEYQIRGSEAPGLMHGLIGIASFTYMMSIGKLSSMIDILKITS